MPTRKQYQFYQDDVIDDH